MGRRIVRLTGALAVASWAAVAVAGARQGASTADGVYTFAIAVYPPIESVR